MKTTVTILFILIFSIRAFGQAMLPVPELIYTGNKDIILNGREWTVYRLDVVNRAQYPDEMFEAAPELPPCGRIKNASRSWVDIFGAGGGRIYGFCELKSSDELKTLAFQLPKGNRVEAVYIVITDRKTGAEYKSNFVGIK